MSINNIEKIIEIQKQTVVREKNIVKELETSFLEYAMSVIVSRALPDARDGFKPVHRRVLYAAYGLGMTSDKPYKKSARLVGEVIGKYHPHGDLAVYETMVRMAQDFSLRYMLIDGHGNFGSVDGDGAAAMRYTEARMSKIADTMMEDIEKETVKFVDNYDGSESEPTVLPGVFPNLLANGGSGIAVGMATNIPPHNLSEILAAVRLLISEPEATIEQIAEVLKGPDFPTAASIVSDQGIKEYFNTGRGSVIVRSKVRHIFEDNRNKIIVDEIPYMVNKKNLIEKITELVKNEEIVGISDLRDESSREGIRVVIELKKDVVPQVLLNKLYKKTQLQTSISVNILALVNNEPIRLNIKEALQVYINHQVDVLIKKVKFDLKKSKEKEHVLEGLAIATHNLDAIIKLIKEAKDNSDALKQLINTYKLSEIQAKAILEMKLRSLSGIERTRIDTELNQLKITIEEYNNILTSRDKQFEIIKSNFDNLEKRFGDSRKTEILYSERADIDDEDLIPKSDILITMSSKGYLKRLHIDTYRAQKRGGVGVTGATTHADDDIAKILVSHTHKDLLLFTNLGKVYKLRGHEIPQGSRTSKGIPAINFVDISKNEKILTILTMDNYNSGFLMFSTANGFVKKTCISQYSNINKNGKIAIVLGETDKLISVVKVNEDDNKIFIAADSGKVVSCAQNGFRQTSRKSRGVKGIKVTDGEKLISMSTSIEGPYILSLGAKGLGKLSDASEFRVTSRGAKGVKAFKESPKTGKLVFAGAVHGDEDILAITSKNKIIRFNLDDVNVIGRNTSGVKFVSLDDNDKIISIALFKKGAIITENEEVNVQA